MFSTSTHSSGDYELGPAQCTRSRSFHPAQVINHQEKHTRPLQEQDSSEDTGIYYSPDEVVEQPGQPSVTEVESNNSFDRQFIQVTALLIVAIKTL
jgi:hypothetical protein